MMARTHATRWLLALLGSFLVSPLVGCQIAQNHKNKGMVQLGEYDPHQPKELDMVSLPTYLIEPPDELEVTVKPSIPDLTLTTAVVQADGVIDMGFVGDIYVSGLTLAQAEMKVSQHIRAFAASRNHDLGKEPLEVSVRLVNGSQSKFYYVLGTVSNQGRFPITGNETVMDALLAAGLKSNSLPEKAYLVRPHPHGAGDQILKIDWCGIKDRGDSTTNYQIFPGDRLVVPGGKPPGLLSTLLGGG